MPKVMSKSDSPQFYKYAHSFAECHG